MGNEMMRPTMTGPQAKSAIRPTRSAHGFFCLTASIVILKILSTMLDKMRSVNYS
jgi:hypothetical protein